MSVEKRKLNFLSFSSSIYLYLKIAVFSFFACIHSIHLIICYTRFIYYFIVTLLSLHAHSTCIHCTGSIMKISTCRMKIRIYCTWLSGVCFWCCFNLYFYSCVVSLIADVDDGWKIHKKSWYLFIIQQTEALYRKFFCFLKHYFYYYYYYHRSRHH